MRTLIICVILTAAGIVRGEDSAWLIVPGRSVGKVSLGMDQAEVFRLLGAPGMQNDFEATDRRANFLGQGRAGEVPVVKGVTQSDWVTPLPLPGKHDQAGYFCDFLTVYVRDDKVVEVEVRSSRFHDAHGLSSAKTAVKWREQYGHGETLYCKCPHPSAGGIPATKRFLFYEDAAGAGVALRCACFGNLAPDPDPDGELDTIIVHAPGEKVLVDPDGGCRFVWKEYPVRRNRR